MTEIGTQRHVGDDKYTEDHGGHTMPHIVEFESGEPEAQRAILRPALNEIAAAVGVVLRDGHLNCPIYLTVPHSGNSIVMMACALDPTDIEWSRATSIVCKVITTRLGDVRLHGRPVVCVLANSTICAADLGTET
jgi:hypothetical protein